MNKLEELVRSTAIVSIAISIPIFLIWLWSGNVIYGKVLATDICLFLSCLFVKYYVIDENI